jgi:tetratricopeptide (TPR) repeat protein
LIALSQSLDQFQILANEDKTNARAQADLASAWERLAEWRAQLGQSTEAIAAARTALAMREEMSKSSGDIKASRRELAIATIRFADIYAATCQFAEARKWYGSARRLVPVNPADAMTAAAVTARLADDKLSLLDAVDAVVKDPVRGLDRVPEALRVPALKKATDWLIKGKKTMAASAVAWQLATVAKTADDRYKAAHDLARCTLDPDAKASAREGFAEDAIKALELAEAAGFRNAELLNDPEWDAFRALPGFQKVLKKIAADKPLDPSPSSSLDK